MEILPLIKLVNKKNYNANVLSAENESFRLFVFHFILDPAYGTSCAPSVLIIFINMMLQKSTEAKEPCKPFMFDGQDALQKTFLVFAFLCVPVMLFGKPVHQIMMARKRKVFFLLLFSCMFLH